MLAPGAHVHRLDITWVLADVAQERSDDQALIPQPFLAVSGLGARAGLGPENNRILDRIYIRNDRLIGRDRREHMIVKIMGHQGSGHLPIKSNAGKCSYQSARWPPESVG